MNLINHLKTHRRMLAVLLLSIFTLTACVSKAENQDIEPQRVSEMPVQQTERRGLTESLHFAAGFDQLGVSEKDRSFHPQIDYFQTLLSYGNNTDPRSTILLVNAYLVAQQQQSGIAFFDTFLKRYAHRLDDQTHAHYLAALAILRASYADEIPLYRRIGWVNRSFELLEQANDLSQGEDPLVNWSAGLVYAQVPFFFFKKEAAYTALNWVDAHPQTEPVSGFYREAYHALAKLHESDGHTALAEKYLKKSAYQDYQPSSLFMGWFTSSPEQGAAMSSRPSLIEVVKISSVSSGRLWFFRCAFCGVRKRKSINRDRCRNATAITKSCLGVFTTTIP